MIAMIGPSIDSGLVCTLTALAILLKGDYQVEEVKGLEIALNAFETAIPGYGAYLLMVMVLIFAFSTMFSYSYYGVKCTNYLFGAEKAKYYNYFFFGHVDRCGYDPARDGGRADRSGVCLDGVSDHDYTFHTGAESKSRHEELFPER